MTIQDKPKTKTMTCGVCGDDFQAALSRRRKLCYRCAQDNMLASWRQMRARSGPIYDKWKASMDAYYKRKAEELNDNRA